MRKGEIVNKAKIILDDDGILLVKMESKSSITEKDAIEICELAAELAEDKTHCNLVDISEMTFMDKKARAVFAKQNKATVPAVAIISNSAFQKSLLNLYFGFSKPIIPTKVFSNVNDARNWLLKAL